jgi:phytoene/squalene synthetase
MDEFTSKVKKEIEEDIAKDFHEGYQGIIQLPKDARFGVYMAYIYYYKLFTKIKSTSAQTILNERVRIPNNKKYSLFVFSYLRHNLNMI